MIYNKFIPSKIIVGILILLCSSISTKVLAEPASEAWFIVGADGNYSTRRGTFRGSTIIIMNPSSNEADVRCLKFTANGRLFTRDTQQITIPPLGTGRCRGGSPIVGDGSALVISDTLVLVTARSSHRRAYGGYFYGIAWKIESYPIEVDPVGAGLMCSESAYEDFETICALIERVIFGNNDTVPSP